MLELIDAGLRLGPFCGPARMLVLSIVFPPPPKTGSGKVRPRYLWFCDAQHKIYIFLPHSNKHEQARENLGDVLIHIGAVWCRHNWPGNSRRARVAAE